MATAGAYGTARLGDGRPGGRHRDPVRNHDPVAGERRDGVEAREELAELLEDGGAPVCGETSPDIGHGRAGHPPHHHVGPALQLPRCDYLGDGNVGAHGGDESVLHHDRAVLDGLTRDGDDAGVLDGEMGRRCVCLRAGHGSEYQGGTDARARGAGTAPNGLWI